MEHRGHSISSKWASSLSARQALEGAEIAPGTEETLSKLTDTSKRPDRLRDPIPREVIEHAPTIRIGGGCPLQEF